MTTTGLSAEVGFPKTEGLPEDSKSQNEGISSSTKQPADDIYQPDAAKELNHSIESITESLEEAERKLDDGDDATMDFKLLQAKYESLKDLDQAVRNNFRLDMDSAPDKKAQKRLDKALDHYDKSINPILAKVEAVVEADEAQLSKRTHDARRYLAEVELAPERPTRELDPLSFRLPDPKPRFPNVNGRVVPAYEAQALLGADRSADSAAQNGGPKFFERLRIAATSSTPPTPEDLTETPDVIITQEMRDLVASLDNSPAKIFDWVYNNIEVELYYGSLKGSVGTFIEKAGNDADTSSLLLALFRAANIPSRYVTGSMDMTIAEAKNLTGVDDPDNVGDLFATAGYPAWKLVSGTGEITGIRIEYVWVEGFVDYIPYGGAKAGPGDTWIPLSPAFKSFDYSDWQDLAAMAGFDTDTFLTDFISSVKTESPAALYKAQIESYLKDNDPGLSWQDGYRTRDIRPEEFRTLPSALGFDVVSVNGEYPELPSSLRHRLTVSVVGDSLSHAANMPELYGHKVTFSYPGATQADNDLIDANGGIENTPPLSVNLVPTIKIDGNTVASGDVTNAGYFDTFRTQFYVPGYGSDSVEYPVVTGEYFAVSLDPQYVSSKYLNDRISQYLSTKDDVPETTANIDEITGEALYLTGLKYFYDSNSEDLVFASAMDCAYVKQTSGLLAGKGLTVDYLFGTPTSLGPGGYYLDAAHLIYGPFSTTGDSTAPLDFMLLGGYSGSYHEHHIFEDFFNENAVSTVKLLQIATEEGQPIYDIDSVNISTILPLLGVSQVVKNDIQNAVASGRVVKISENNLTVDDWTGVGYIVQNPVTNAASYLISGGFAGGRFTKKYREERNICGPGNPPPCTYVGDPVSLANGNLFTTETDFSVTSRGLSVEVVRYHNSQSDYDGPFGFGWSWMYDEHLEENPDESVTYKKGDGGAFTFPRQPDGTYGPPAGIFTSLAKDGSGFTLRETNGTESFFDLNGKLVSVTDRNENEMSFAYAGDDLVKITDTAGREYLLSYNPAGKITSITAPGGRVWTYSYNANDLVRVTDPESHARSYTYHADHNLATLTNALGGTYVYDYYSNDKTHTSVLPNGGVYHFSYNPPLGLTTATDPNGASTIYYYDQAGALTGVLDPLGNEETYEYDNYFNPEKITDKRGGVTKNVYDYMGNLLSTTNQLNQTADFAYEPAYNQITSITGGLGHTITPEYDASGNLTRLLDSQGNETAFAYNANGDLLNLTTLEGESISLSFNLYGDIATIEDTAGGVKSFSYDEVGNLVSQTDADGNVTTYIHDLVGNVVEVQDPMGTTQYGYDVNGNRTSVTDVFGNVTTFAHDSLNRQTSTTDPLGNTTTYFYDLNGNRTSIVDTLGNSTFTFYDELNRPVMTRDAAGNETRYSHDAAGNLISLGDAKGNITQFEYDLLNRKTKTVFPDGSTETSSYDSRGNIASESDRSGNTINYVYDTFGRITNMQYPDATEVQYAYDALGRPQSVSNPSSAIGYTYDDFGRVSQVDQNGHTVGYEYDARGRRTKLMYPDGDFITYSYDPVGRIDQIRDSSDSVIADYDLDATGLKVELLRQNGIQTLYEYDDAKRLTTLTNKVKSSGALISSYHYARDSLGAPTSVTTASRTDAYSFDSLGQLTGVTYDSNGTAPAQVDYTFDSLGNRIAVADDAGTTYYAANRLNQYTNVGPQELGYDENGNLVSDDPISYIYDYEDRVTSVATPAGVVNYVYDALGRRLSTSTASGTTTYVYDNEHVIAEVNASGGLVAKYVYGSSVDEVLKMDRGTANFYSFDGIGSVSDITDASGTLVESYTYDVYGRATISDGAGNVVSDSTVDNSLMFAGKRYDQVANLYYSRARDYEPSLGRFMQADPAGFVDGPNLYTYGRNNPVANSDPYGLMTIGYILPYVQLGWFAQSTGGTLMWTWDNNANMGWLWTYYKGAGIPAIALGTWGIQVSTASTIYDLAGYSLYVGGGLATPVPIVSVDISLTFGLREPCEFKGTGLADQLLEGDFTYIGISLGIEVGTPYEAHILCSYSELDVVYAATAPPGKKWWAR